MIQIKKWSLTWPFTVPTCRRDLVTVLAGPCVGGVFLLGSNSVSLPFFCRWLKAIGSGAVSQCKWTVPFSQASMGCGTCMSLLWCSCMHHPIRTMGMTSRTVSSSPFSTALFQKSRILSLQDLNSKGSGFPSPTFPPGVEGMSIPKNSRTTIQKASAWQMLC